MYTTRHPRLLCPTKNVEQGALLGRCLQDILGRILPIDAPLASDP